MTALERLAYDAWVAWGRYAKFTICTSCGENGYCRSRHGARFLCLGCFDQEAGR